MAWWDHVTEIPEVSKMMVLSSGSIIGSTVRIPTGGHNSPSSISGVKLLWR